LWTTSTTLSLRPASKRPAARSTTYCDRRFFLDSVASARIFVAPSGDYVLTDDIASTTGLVVKVDSNGDGTYPTTLTSSQYQLEPINGIAKGDSITRIVATTRGLFPTSTAPAGVQVTAARSGAGLRSRAPSRAPASSWPAA
jgi:hypothetical protein